MNVGGGEKVDLNLNKFNWDKKYKSEKEHETCGNDPRAMKIQTHHGKWRGTSNWFYSSSVIVRNSIDHIK